MTLRPLRFRAVLVSLLLAGVGGCKMFGQQGPVSKPVAEARELSQRGLSAMEQGDTATAESLLSQAVKACPEDLDARRHYAEALWARGERELAVQHLLQAAALAPDDAGVAVRAGEMQLALGQMDDARRMANRVLDLNPSDGGAWALRGRVKEAAGELDGALADLNRALEFRRDDRELLYDTAEVYRRLGRPQRALSTLIALRDTYGPGEEPQQVLYLQGMALAALGRHSDAVDAFALALEHGSPSPELLCRLGQSQLAAGKPAEADRTIQQALSMDPNYAPSQAVREQIEVASRPLSTVLP